MLRLAALRTFKVLPIVRPTPLATSHLYRAASTLHRSAPNAIQLHKPGRLSLIAFNAYQKRYTASSVAGLPASEDLPHAIQNAREEAKGVAKDIAQIIAAANFDKRAHEMDGFSDITAGLAGEVPKPVLYTGLAGSLPYLGSAMTTLYYAREAGLLAIGHAARVDYDTAMNILEAATHVQVTYGAVLLSFLGALHWGMEFAGYGGHQGYRRLALGVAPVAFAWSTLLLTPSMALVAQWGGFTALWYADMRATAAGWTPIWYSQYRFYLSILIGSCMVATLWGAAYLNPVIEHTTFATTSPASSNTPDQLVADGRIAGTSSNIGDIETVEGLTHYVVLKHKADEASEAGEGEGEQHAAAAEDQKEVEDEQAKKDDQQSEGRGKEIRVGK